MHEVPGRHASSWPKGAAAPKAPFQGQVGRPQRLAPAPQAAPCPAATHRCLRVPQLRGVAVPGLHQLRLVVHGRQQRSRRQLAQHAARALRHDRAARTRLGRRAAAVGGGGRVRRPALRAAAAPRLLLALGAAAHVACVRAAGEAIGGAQ